MTGHEFIEDVMKITLSPLAADVADFLADWYGGMHNFVHQTNIKKIDWENKHHLVVPFGRGMATIDDHFLTSLVVMSHDRMLRVEVNPRARGWLELVFHRRTTRDGRLYERMPTMEDHIKYIRDRQSK